ncbi:hypothetical protein [Pseudomonas sp. TE3610]
MPDIMKMANSGLLLSHKKFYKTPRSFSKILGGNNRRELLLHLSILSYAHKEEKFFREWAIKKICKTKSQRAYAQKRAVFSRLQCWRLWTLLFKEWSSGMDSPGARPEYEVLHEAFAKLNDRPDDLKDDNEQVFLKAITSNGRDHRLLKLRRAQHIFCTESPLTPYIKVFEKKIGVPIKTYISTIYYLIEYWHDLRAHLGKTHGFDEWGVSAEWFSIQLNTPASQIAAIFKEISFSAAEGKVFSDNTNNKPNEFILYRERPLFEIDNGKYIPVEGKLLEELLFENLLYRVHDANGKVDVFLSKFGFEFERYAQSYGLSLMNGLGQYKVIEEFSFGADGGLKSPDLMIAVPEENCIVVFEFKSARPLYASLSSENKPEKVNESLEKLFDKPWEQSVKAVTNIMEKQAHPAFNEGVNYFFVIVTMNNYPMTLKENVIRNMAGKDISSYFHSFDIETFELLMRAARLSPEYSLRDQLKWCYDARHEMSAKTKLKHFVDVMETRGVVDDHVYHELLQEAVMQYRSYFKSFSV